MQHTQIKAVGFVENAIDRAFDLMGGVCRGVQSVVDQDFAVQVKAAHTALANAEEVQFKNGPQSFARDLSQQLYIWKAANQGEGYTVVRHSDIGGMNNTFTLYKGKFEHHSRESLNPDDFVKLGSGALAEELFHSAARRSTAPPPNPTAS